MDKSIKLQSIIKNEYDTFNKDLKFGQKYEKHALKYITYDKYEFAPNCKFKDYDIKCFNNNNIELYEVKTDRWTYKTNNICIEFNCNNKPSGIETTKANKYIYFSIKNNIIDEVYIIPVDIIKTTIKNNKPMIKNIGFKCRASCYLINKELFKKYLISP
jgi:hypothetical protein